MAAHKHSNTHAVSHSRGLMSDRLDGALIKRVPKSLVPECKVHTHRTLMGQMVFREILFVACSLTLLGANLRAS